MKLFSFEATQQLPIPLQEAWDFFSTPGNLKEITPPHMGFEITSGTPGKMYAGQMISYVVKPIAGIPLTWVTEITHVREPYYFVDEQRSGPYKIWHHEHLFRETNGGVEMRDLVHYALPAFGSLMNKIFVRKELEKIFSFRKAKLEALFGEG
jgi:ligand-binding SRPBCC domain-containing protein